MGKLINICGALGALVRDMVSVVAGVALLALDVLPILIWAAFIGGRAAGSTDPLPAALVGGTFLAAVALSFVTAPLMHRLSHAWAAKIGDARARRRNAS